MGKGFSIAVLLFIVFFPYLHSRFYQPNIRMQQIYQKGHSLVLKNIIRASIFSFVVFFQSLSASAQCPDNIDFEFGDFSGWQCYTGDFINGNLTLIPSPPTANRHTMLTAFPTGNGRDKYGNFPRNCPNGSGHSIQLGNEQGGHGAEAVSYTFTIPANLDKYSLIYNYAMVLNDGGHATAIQPRLQITVQNVTDGTPLPCPLDPFAINGSLPGFFISSVSAPGNADPVRCRNWVASSLNLDNLAGKTITITFITTDCGNTAHFGYAYIDISSQCGSAFTGATFCPDDTAVTVTAPYGYEEYGWWNGTHTTLLGTTQALTLNPPPLSGDSLIVDLTPYTGYGCPASLKAYLFDTLTVQAIAGPDKKTCDNKPVQLGVPPRPGLVYHWTPVTGLSNPDISNPIATPSVTTQYTLLVTNNGGGCATPASAKVTVDVLSDSIELIGVNSKCVTSTETTALKVLPHDSIQWYKDNVPIPGPIGNQQLLNITQSGAYYATVFSFSGCTRNTVVKQIDIWPQPIADFSSNTLKQCDFGNQFILTNKSTVPRGNMQYDWDLGDGSAIQHITDINYNYAKPGNYTVLLKVTGDGGCVDTHTANLVVAPSPVAAFAVDEPIQCFKDNWFVFSNKSNVSQGILTYTWDFGDGNIDHSNDIAHHYINPGTYTVALRAQETSGGCTSDSIFKVLVNQSPVTDFSINNNTQCFPGHQFVLTNNTTILSDTLLYTWSMGDGIIKTPKDFIYSYAKPGNYTIKLLANTLAGCVDSISQNVIVHPTPSADFSARTVCENLQVPIINRTYNNTTSTLNYLWDFDNGHTDNVMTPRYSYPSAGTYALTLTVSSAQCPLNLDSKTVNLTIDGVAPGIVYPDKDAAFNYAEPLNARQLGSNSSVIWTPPVSLSNRFSFNPVFKGINPQLYSIKITTSTGCITIDTQLVKTHKKIEIYVPNSFTPDGDGNNDRLRPVLIGFTKVNYFRVFNRWGKLLFSMNSDQPGWDGIVNGQPAETQTVVWMIEAVDVDGVVHQKQGTTVLYR